MGITGQEGEICKCEDFSGAEFGGANQSMFSIECASFMLRMTRCPAPKKIER